MNRKRLSKRMARSDNEARATQIMTVAADLFARFGYDKTTVNEIARAARISKGAVYLHFDSKDALFEALLLHEMAKYTETWLDLLDADADGGTLGGMYKNMLYALNSSAFMKAVFTQDQSVFGSYLHKPNNLFHHAQGDQPSPRFQFVKTMQEAGAIRQDVDPKVTAHIMNMLAYSLVTVGTIIPATEMPPFDALLQGIADMMERAFSPQVNGDREIGKVIVRQIAEATRQQFDINVRKHVQ